MKKILLTTLIFISFLPALSVAGDIAKLRIALEGLSHKQTDLLCISSRGCFSLGAAKSTEFAIDAGEINGLYMASTTTLKMYPESLPASCNVTVKEGQTLVVSGYGADSEKGIIISKLKCKII